MNETQKILWDDILKQRAIDLFAGVSGGILSTLCCHPLDLIKIRLAVNDGHKSRPFYHNLKHVCRSLYANGGVASFYQGVTPNLIGAASSWGLYFFFYNSFKRFHAQHQHTPLSAGMHLIAAAESGILTLGLTNPIWVSKTRLCLQYVNTGTISRDIIVYRGFLDCISKIYATEGVRGLYAGFSAGLFGVSHGAIQFMVYEELKKWYYSSNSLHASKEKVPTQYYLLFSALSKFFAAATTYPYQVVRARLQDQHRKYDGAIDVIKVSVLIVVDSFETNKLES